MNIHRIYIYAPIAGAYPADLEQALAQGEQIRQSGSGQAVPEALLTMAAKLEEYAEKWSEGVNEDEDEDDELQERLGNLKARVQRKGVPVISFEMPHEGWERLLWEMVEKAGPLGLVGSGRSDIDSLPAGGEGVSRKSVGGLAGDGGWV